MIYKFKLIANLNCTEFALKVLNIHKKNLDTSSLIDIQILIIREN